jgi:hypothetical protein
MYPNTTKLESLESLRGIPEWHVIELTNILLFQEEQQVMELLSDLLTFPKRIFILHAELVRSTWVQNYLQSMSSTVMQFMEREGQPVIQIQTRKSKMGKQWFLYNAEGELRPVPSVFASMPVPPKQEKEGWDVSFKLDLSDKEKQQREGTVLPYTEAQIEYTYDPEEFDDEDDPDEDLDI